MKGGGGQIDPLPPGKTTHKKASLIRVKSNISVTYGSSSHPKIPQKSPILK